MKGTATPTDDFYLEKRMRSFVYLSSAKLEPLYAHIKEPIRKRVALALGISVPALPVAPHFEAQARSPTESKIGMLAVVLSHLHEAGDIGTVDEPRPYFAGQLTLNWGSADEFVFLSGSTPRTLVVARRLAYGDGDIATNWNIGADFEHLREHDFKVLLGTPIYLAYVD